MQRTNPDEWVRSGIVFTTQNIFGGRSDLQRLKELLSRLSMGPALDWTVEQSRQNHLHLAFNATWQKTRERFAEFVNAVLPTPYHVQAWRVFGEEGFISPFSELGLVALTGLICRFCRPLGSGGLMGKEMEWKLVQAALSIQGCPAPEEPIKRAARAQGDEVGRMLKAQFPYMTRAILAISRSKMNGVRHGQTACVHKRARGWDILGCQMQRHAAIRLVPEPAWNYP